jgi:hypothetical protein
MPVKSLAWMSLAGTVECRTVCLQMNVMSLHSDLPSAVCFVDLQGLRGQTAVDMSFFLVQQDVSFSLSTMHGIISSCQLV